MASAKTLFVTATGTGVGKTFVACALARHLRDRGIDVGVMKPVATGCVRKGGSLRSRDTEDLVEASGVKDAADLVTPVTFEPPLAPTAASRVSGRAFDREAIFRAYAELRSRHEVLLVEGIGGLLVPVAVFEEGPWTVRDMAREMGTPLVVVSRNTLGTINHTALTCESAKGAGLAVRGIVLNSVPGAAHDSSAETNADDIMALTGVRVAARLGQCGSWREAAALLDARVVDGLVGLD